MKPDGVDDGSGPPMAIDEQQERDAENRSQWMLDVLAAQDKLIIRFSPDGRYEEFIQPAESAIRFQPSSFLGRHFREVLPPHLAEKTQQAILAIQETGQEQEFFYYLKIAGQLTWWHAQLSPRRDQSGKLIGHTGVVRNVSREKKRDEELRQLSEAVRQSPVATVITDTRGSIMFVNPAFVRMSGYSLEEVRGKNPNMLKSGETSAEVYASMWETIIQGGSWQGEFQNRKKDGTPYWVSARIAPVNNEAGVMTNFVAVEEDITERRNRETMARDMQNMLVHEIKGPLTSLLGALELLEIQLDDGDSTQFANKKLLMDMARKAGRRIDQQVSDLQDVAALEEGKMGFQFEETDLRTCLENVLEENRQYDRNVPLLPVRMENMAMTCPIWTDPSRLGQAVANLVTNAMKQSHGTGQAVEVVVRQINAQQVRIEVRDQGEGLTPEQQTKLFRKFGRLSNGNGNGSKKGTGLGLVIVKMITEKLGGQVGVESAKGVGSTFFIDLPLQPL